MCRSLSISSTIVTYRQREDSAYAARLANCIIGLLASGFTGPLYIIDNSRDSSLQAVLPSDSRIKYQHLGGRNIGFGAAHNLVRSLELGTFHLILNPDIVFPDSTVLKNLVELLEKNPSFSMIQPLICDVHPPHHAQRLCKRNPTLLAQIGRAVLGPVYHRFFRHYNEWYEMQAEAYGSSLVSSTYLSGAFMLCRTERLCKAGWFDPAFFLYLEDADLTRRLAAYGPCVHCPWVTVYHHWARLNRTRLVPFLSAAWSFVIYSRKWGLLCW
jgi:GT2 family glycosyltransferase